MSKRLVRFQPLQTFCHTGLQGTRRYAVSVDIITQQLERLVIGYSKKNAAQEEQKALVPYNGVGTIIPYEGFDPTKRRKPRPSVDIDLETIREWNFLMWEEGRAEPMDKDREKWWEDERKIVHGRVDSFVARMRLVQGNKEYYKPFVSTTTHICLVLLILMLSTPTRQII